MDVLKSLVAEIIKMFFADIGLTSAAVATVFIAGELLNMQIIAPDVSAYIVTGGILLALIFGVERGLAVANKAK